MKDKKKDAPTAVRFFIAKNQKKVLTNKLGGFIIKIPLGGIRIKGKDTLWNIVNTAK